MNLSLIYFNFPFWRAEVSRIALHIGNIEFNDLRISRDEFIRVKASGKLDNGIIIPFHQLPCLIIEGEALLKQLEQLEQLDIVENYQVISPKK